MLALALALVVAAPAATAGWKTFASFEPDTPQDFSGGFMHTDPDWDASPGVRKTYFNVVVAYEEVSINQNAGALESRIMVEGYQWPYAWLGVWKDCNKDGYIGYGAGALVEYHASLLTVPDAANICPAGTSEHNDGEWVFEFLPIGPADNVPEPRDALPRIINDTGAFVWGDSGLPGAPHGGGCFLNPPTGTFDSTGAFLGWSDCMTGYQVYKAAAVVDPDGGLNIKWDSMREPHCDDSIVTSIHLGIWRDVPQCPDEDPGTLESGTGKPAFNAYDCSEDPAFVVQDDQKVTRHTVADPTGGALVTVFGEDGEENVFLSDENYTVHKVYTPRAVTPDAEGSWFDAANETFRGTAASCDPDAALPYADGEWEVANEMSVKRQTVFAFQFRADEVHSFTPAEADPMTEGIPRFGGVHNLRTMSFFLLDGPMWRPNVLSYNTVIISDTDLSPQGATYYTFYARISNPATMGVPGPTGIYGSEWCEVSTDPTKNGGFDCDATNWWDRAKGASAMPREAYTNRPIGQKPGDAYQFRDIDCYDGTIFGPVKLGLGDISEEGVCAPPQAAP